MADNTGFINFTRRDTGYQKPEDRRAHFGEFTIVLTEPELHEQAARCMTCGIPSCHMPSEENKSGCPIENNIPDFNDAVHRNQWEKASAVLKTTNNYGSITGRVCPAPCEAACTLSINDDPVTIKQHERAIADRAWEEGWMRPQMPGMKTGIKIAIVGSGPAGMACAQELSGKGHDVELFEKNEKIGGLLRFGIPNFKLEKEVVDRHLALMEAQGVVFRCGVNVGVDLPVDRLVNEYDAVVLTGGSEIPRNVAVPGRDLDGIHFAMEFLTQQNRRAAMEELPNVKNIFATDKDVVVIGGGDTGSDCIGTAYRQGAKSITQLEILPKPPEKLEVSVWPKWPNVLRTTSSHLEGETGREFAVDTQSFFGENGRVKGLNCVRVENFKPIAGTEFQIKADLVLIAAGFTGATQVGLLEGLGVNMDRGRVVADMKTYRTSHPSGKIFTAGDMRRGQSLVVWAFREGRDAAQAVDRYLMGLNPGLREARADYPPGSRAKYLSEQMTAQPG